MDYDAEAYSNVIYQRTEYTSERITAFFNLDVDGIRTLGLPQEAQELLYCLALYKVRRLLDGCLRLRTACDLRQTGELRLFGIGELPAAQILLNNLKESIKKCASLFAKDGVTTLNVNVKEKMDKKKGNATDDEEA